MDIPVQGRRRKPTPGLLRATVVSSNGSPDLPLTLWKRKVGRNFQPFVAVFGQTFVMSAVESIRAKRHEMNIKTYWMNVEGLEKTLAVLATLAPNLSLHKGALHLDDSSAALIERTYISALHSEHPAYLTELKHLVRAKVIFAYLAAAGIVSRRITFGTDAGRVRAPIGQAKQPPSLTDAPRPHDVSPDRLNFVAQGEEHPYGQYKPLGEAFMTEVVEALYQFSRSHGRGLVGKVRDTFRSFLALMLVRKRSKFSLAFYDQLEGANFREIKEEDWHLEVGHWRTHIVDSAKEQGLKPITPHRHIKLLNQTLGRLASLGLLPPTKVKGIKGAKSRHNTTHRKNFAQLSRGAKEKRQALYDQFMAGLGESFQGAEDADAVESFLEALCDTLPAKDLEKLSLSELSAAIQKLNRERLVELRRYAETEFITWYEHWLEGQAAMRAAGVVSEAETLRLLDGDTALASEVRKNSAQLFLQGTPASQLGNLVNYAWASVNGITSARLGRLHHLQRRLGGRERFQAYLRAHPRATVALWVMLLVDTGANSEVCREAPWECLKVKKDNLVKVTLGNKKRAGGKEIDFELPEAPSPGERISTIHAIRAYKAMYARHRDLADADLKNRLFLTVPQSRIKLLTEYNAREWFKALTSSSPLLSDLGMLPSMIRASKLLDTHLSHGLSQAQAVGDHADAATTLVHYTGRAPVNAGYSLLMREFTDRYEAVAASTIEDAARKLRIDPTIFEERLRVAAATGLAGLSLDLQGVQLKEHVPPAVPFQMTTRFVVATDRIIAELIALNERLAAESRALDEQTREGWESQWLPWLVFSEVAVAKLSTGETAADFVRVRKAIQDPRAKTA